MLKKLYSFLTLLTAFLWLGSGTMWGATLTVADGSATNTGVPICGNYADTKGMRSQFIYPSSLLTDMEYGAISKVKFYSSTASKAFTSTFEVRLSEISASTLSGFNTDGGTKVYTGSLTIADNEMEITFDTPYEYNGDGNLLFDIEVTANTSAWVNAAFYGITQSGAGYSNKVNYGGAQVCNLLPKATFSYTPGTPPTCPKPKNLNLTDLSSASASFGWTKGASETSWQYVCLPAATAVDWSDAAVKIANTTPAATVAGLTAETSYKFYVRAYCGSSDQSTELVKAFKTPCAGESLPWDCGFETSEGYSTGSYSSAAPTCWDMLNANQGAYPYIYISTSYAKSGNGLYFQSSKSKYGYIILPPFEHGLDVLKLSFSHKEEGTSSTAGQITVGYMTDPADEESFVPVRVCTRVTSHTTVSDILFTGAPSYGRIAFRYGGGTGDQWYAGIDDIHVEATMDCGKPATPTYTDLTGSSVTINWAANAGVTDYKYINVDRTANPTYVLDWTNDAIAISATSVDLTSLTDGHNYEFYVMCACGTVASDACEYTPLSCPTVTSVTLSNQVWDGVTVNWTTSATTNCDVQYKIGEGVWTEDESNISATSKSFSGLVPGTEYSFRVKPHCSADGWVSPALPYTPACPALGALTLSGQTYNGVTVSWSATTGISSWNLRYRKGSDSWTEVNNIEALTHTIESGLVTNEEYTIELYSECGNYMTTTYTPVYTAPTSVAVAVQDLGGDASWAPVTGATGYQYIVVLKDAAQDWTSPATGTTISSGYVHADPVLSGLHAKTAYDFYVKAVFAGGTSSATKKSFTTSSHAPNTPTVADGDITSSSAVATWTLPTACQATQCQWICKLTSAGTPADDDAAWSAPTTEFTANISGLDAYTDYTVYVRAYYEDGIYSANASKTFKTDCGTVGLPLEKQTFSSSIPACWASSYTGNEWGYEYYGTYHSAYYSAQYLANTATTNSADLKTPTISVTDKATLTFWYRNYYYKSYVTYYATGEVLFDDGESETKLWDIDHTSSSIVQKSIDLSDFNLVGKTGRFIFRGHGAGTSSYARMWIDDVEITINPISDPTNLAAAPTADGADVTWDAEEGPYNLQYRINGSSDDWTLISNIADKNYTLEGLASGTTYEVQVCAHASANRVSDWTASVTFTPVNCPVPTTLGATAITHNSATISWSGDAKTLRYKTGSDDWTNETISPAAETLDLSDLAAESTYTVQVKADCEEGDTWSDALEFTTKCTPISITKVAPYEADFTGLDEVMPACWDKSATTKPYVKNEELLFDGKDQTAILPKFSNATSTLMLKFNYKHSYAASYSGQIQVGYIDASGDFQAFGSALSGATAYTAAEINFDGVDDDEAKYIAIRLIHNNPSNISYANGFIKDVVVELAPTCYAPASIYDAASITASGATLSWTASGKGETQYQWAVAEGSAEPAWVDDDDHKVSATSKELSGLNPQTEYTFYVRSYCGGDDQSEAISKAFTTKCAAIAVDAMPFEEDFADMDNFSTPDCWKTYPASAYHAYVNNETLDVNASKNAGSESVVVLPEMAMPLNQLVVSFDYKGSNGTIEVGYVANAEDKTTFSAVGSAYTVASAYKQAGTALTSVGEATGNVALRFKGNTGDGTFTVDNIRVAYGVGLADNADNRATLQSLYGQTIDVSIGRTLVAADYYNTLCLPFDVPTLAGTPLAGGDLWAFKYAKVDEATDELLFRIIESDHIEAGVPYFIAFPDNAENIVNPLFKNVTISATVGQEVGNDVAKLCGIVDQPVVFNAGDQSKLFLAANNTLYWWAGSSASQLNSFRAYFKVSVSTPSAPSPARHGMRARIIKEDQEEQIATGINNTNLENVTIKFIENNQVVIIRNGVKYNIQGQVISK